METEAKFVIPDEETLNRLKEVERLGPYTRRDTHEKKVHDRYVDTPDRSFQRNNYFARLRESKSGGALLLTIKSAGKEVDGAIHSREEYQTEVQGLDAREWPEGDARRITQEIAGDQTLTDLVIVDQTRTISYLYQGERKAAELSLDDITLPASNNGEEPVRAYELEAELLPDGIDSDLRILSTILTEDYHLAPQPLSKFERAMQLSQNSPSEAGMGKSEEAATPKEAQQTGTSTRRLTGAAHSHKPPKEKREMGVLPTDSVGVAARKILRMHFDSMLANEEGTREGEDPEALHDMRVATRRMRAAIRVLNRYLDEEETGRVQRGLRSVARALGSVRDLDVLLLHARNFRDTLPDEQKPDMDGLLGDWGDERRRMRKKMLSLLNSKDYTRFRSRMEAFLSDQDAAAPPDQHAGAEPYQVRHVAGSTIWGRYEEVRAFETLMDAPTIEQLHALRIKGKYLRYTLECFRETLPQDATALIRDVVKMQDQLGELHDASVASELIHAYIDKKHKRGRDEDREAVPPGLAAYLSERQAAERRIYTEFHETWANLDSKQWRKRLASVITAM